MIPTEIGEKTCVHLHPTVHCQKKTKAAKSVTVKRRPQKEPQPVSMKKSRQQNAIEYGSPKSR